MKKMIFLMLCLLLMSAAPIHAESKTSTATKTEQVSNQAADQNPVVGKDKKGRTIHQGKKGGLYYWTTTKKGENAGKVRKGYLTKAEKDEFYREHPNVKQPTNN